MACQNRRNSHTQCGGHDGYTAKPYVERGITDITYIPIQGGFINLCAVIDWYSRAVLAWELSNTLDAGFCVQAVAGAMAEHGVPEIFNPDQGCQFTSAELT